MLPLRRFAVPVLALALVAGLILASCSDEGDAVLDDGGDLELTGGGTTCTSGDPLDIPDQICDLFNSGTETSFLDRYDNVKRKLNQGKTAVAIEQMLELIASVFDQADKAQGSSPQKEEDLAELVEDLFAAIGITVDLDPAVFAGGGAAIIGPAGGSLGSANGYEVLVVPPGAVGGPTLFVITPLDDGSDPLPTDLLQVPKYFDNTAFALDGGGPSLGRGPRPVTAGVVTEFDEPVTVALCAVTDGLSSEVADRLQLAHDIGGEIEILDPVPVPSGLDCDDAVDESALLLRRPSTGAGGALAGGKEGPRGGAALHGGLGVGGQVSSFSDFGAVDPESETTIEGIVFTDNEGEQPVEGADVDLYCETPEPLGLRGPRLGGLPLTATTTSNGDGFYSFSAGEDGFAAGDNCFLEASFSDEYSFLFGNVDNFDVESGLNEKDIAIELFDLD